MPHQALPYKSKYGTYNVYLKAGKYPNGRMAIEIIDAADGCPIMKATINMPSYDKLGANEFIIKNYSENEGVLDWLIDNEFVTKPKRYANSGFTSCPVVEVLPKLLEYCGSKEVAV